MSKLHPEIFQTPVILEEARRIADISNDDDRNEEIKKFAVKASPDPEEEAGEDFLEVMLRDLVETEVAFKDFEA